MSFRGMGIVFLFPTSCRNCASFSPSNPKYIKVKRNQDSVQVCWRVIPKIETGLIRVVSITELKFVPVTDIIRQKRNI